MGPSQGSYNNSFSRYSRKMGRGSSAKGMKKVVRRVWRGITTQYLQIVYESMPRRMEAVIAAGGGHTKYWNSLMLYQSMNLSVNIFFLPACAFFCFKLYYLAHKYILKQNMSYLLSKISMDFKKLWEFFNLNQIIFNSRPSMTF